jgi:hypothetical protein
LKFPAYWSITLLLLASSFAHSQQDQSRGDFLVNQELRVSGLPVRTAASADPAAVLVAALETIFHDPDVCCGKNSVLQPAALSVDPLSLKDLGAKIQGRYVLDDGRRIAVTAEYLPPSSINPYQIIASLAKNQALFVEWKSHLYVLYGAVFDEIRGRTPETNQVLAIHKLFLLDARFSDARRETSLAREGNSQTDLQGLLILKLEPQ